MDEPRKSGATVWRSVDDWRRFMVGRYPGVDIRAKADGFGTSYRSWVDRDIELAEIVSASRQSIYVDVPDSRTPDCYYLPLQLAGEVRGGQFGRECRAEHRTIYLLDSRAPHWRVLDRGSRLLNVRLPKTLFAQHLNSPPNCMIPIDASTGPAAVIWDLALSIWQRREELGTAMPRMVTQLAMMMAGLFSIHDDSKRDSKTVVGDHRRRLLQCIEAHLGDPCFDVAQAAAHCGISPRYVHFLMQETGRTFARHLIERRLDGCSADLRTSGSRSITDVAFAWGFNNLSHFSRAFRSRYGNSPTGFRKTSR